MERKRVELTSDELELLVPAAAASYEIWVKSIKRYDRYNHAEAPISHEIVRFG